MNFVAGFLDALEKLTYRILMWAILFPKTLLRIIVDPRWVPGYIKGQLLPIQKNPFNEYVSPVTFFIVISLAPLIFLPYLPEYGGTKLTPWTVGNDRNVRFNAEMSFKPHSDGLWHETRWVVGIMGPDMFMNFNYPDMIAEYIYGESHYASGVLPLTLQDDRFIVIGNPYELNSDSSLAFGDRRVTDVFFYNFSGLGPEKYTVGFYGAYYVKGADIPVESDYSYLSVEVPQDPLAPLKIQGQDEDRESPDNADDKPLELSPWDELQRGLQSGDTYQLTLSLLALPLAFAVIGRGLRKQNISEESLKVGFYTQCYLLSPVSAAYWATTYANEYVTPDIFFFSRTNLYQYQDYVTWFPFALILLWFFFVEIGMIARERGIGKFRAFLVLLRYVFTLFALLVFVTNTWFFRKATIFGYVLLVLLLILIGAIKDLQKARKDANPKENR